MIVGIDMSLNHSGWVILDAEGFVHSNGCIEAGDKRGYARTVFVVESLILAVKTAKELGKDVYVNMEEYTAGGPGRRTAMEIAKIQGIFVYFMYKNSIPVYLTHPSQLRLFQKFNFSKLHKTWKVHEEDAWGLACILGLKLDRSLRGHVFDLSHGVSQMIERIGPVFVRGKED